MSDKLLLMKKAFNKLCINKEFMAYFLARYSDLENLTIGQVLLQLKCLEEDYFRLALCKVPFGDTADDFKNTQDLGNYVQVDTSALWQIIKYVNNLDKLYLESSDRFLMAARQLTKKNDDER